MDNSTCGQCKHWREVSETQGICGAVLPAVHSITVFDDKGQPGPLSFTVRPTAGRDDPSCATFAPRTTIRAAAMQPAFQTAHSLKCANPLCGWPAVEDGLCETHLEERDAAENTDAGEIHEQGPE